MSPSIWGAAVAAFILSFLTVIVLRPLLRRYGVMDTPSDRSSHTTTTLRGGGVSVFVGLFTGSILAMIAVPSIDRAITLSILGGVLLAALIGFIEDTRGLPVPARAGAQVVTGVVIAVPLGIGLGQPWWVVGSAAVAIMLFINIANFMDGINGISGFHAVVIGMAYAVLGLSANLPWATAIGVMVAAAFIGFLPWNLSKPGLFLGDIGSYVLGSVLSALAFAILWSGVSAIAVVAPLSIYLADTLFTIGRRARRGEAVLQSHRSHAYQRLTDTGLTHQGASSVVVGFTVGASTAGFLAERNILSGVAAWGIVLGLCTIYLAIPRMRGSRLPGIASMQIAPIEQPPVTSHRHGYAPAVWAVYGASGFVGGAVIDRLRSEGAEVREISGPRLRLSPLANSPIEIASLASNMSASDDLARHLEGVDVVVNAAGLATPGSPPSAELYGANTLLPAVILHASQTAGVSRVIHLSSAAVQGHRAVLDDSLEVSPFSPYSRSKALGERAFFSARRGPDIDAVVVRATSVQGDRRPTTESLRRIARSPLASVAGTGTQPTVVSTIDGLVDFIVHIGRATTPLAPIMLQPWEGMSTVEVLRAAGGKEPAHLPLWVCRALLGAARIFGRVVPEIAGVGRRVELMWLGQRQHSFNASDYEPDRSRLPRLLAGASVRSDDEGHRDVAV